ncbi:MAG: hypothetical protein K8L99_13995 [Anaerolineae bacterium]|nr:hypothetical protein [Anaerolineae bacterium]
MIHLKPQTAIGGFTLVKLLLAGTTIGRVLGISFDEALYLPVVVLIGITWAVNRFWLRQPASEQRETEE